MDFVPELLAYCGIYCEQCSARVAVALGDMAHLGPLLEKFRETRPELSDWDCEGCKGENICGPCKIKDCAVAKSVAHCGECDDFPCEIVSAFENDGWPHHRRALENLRNIREHGVKIWFEDLRPELQCHCGRRQSWYLPCPEHSSSR